MILMAQERAFRTNFESRNAKTAMYTGTFIGYTVDELLGVQTWKSNGDWYRYKQIGWKSTVKEDTKTAAPTD